MICRRCEYRSDGVIVARLEFISDMLIENGEGVDKTGQIVVSTDLFENWSYKNSMIIPHLQLQLQLKLQLQFQ